jgi:hypothetical protein
MAKHEDQSQISAPSSRFMRKHVNLCAKRLKGTGGKPESLASLATYVEYVTANHDDYQIQRALSKLVWYIVSGKHNAAVGSLQLRSANQNLHWV